MTWRVEFSAPVVYLPGHPKAERTITSLDVGAPSADHARTHALRVTQGDAMIVSVEALKP